MKPLEWVTVGICTLLGTASGLIIVDKGGSEKIVKKTLASGLKEVGRALESDE